jgi:ABC-type Na+ efflux pump permease subunit
MGIPIFTIITSLISQEVFTPQTLAFAELFRESLKDKLVDLTSKDATAILIMVSALPLLMVILGGYSSLAAATRSIAGEKENQTIEVLLSLPITLKHIFLAKILSSTILGFVCVGFISLIGVLGPEMYYHSVSGGWLGLIYIPYVHVGMLLAFSTILISSMAGTILSAWIKNALAALYVGGIVPALPVLAIVLLFIHNPQLSIKLLTELTTLTVLASFPILTIFASKVFKGKLLS